MGLETIQSNDKSLPELVAGQITGLIADNEYKKGEKLPNEFQLAQSLNVGRGTIREAIKILVSKNIVEIRRGLGTFVAEKPGGRSVRSGIYKEQTKAYKRFAGNPQHDRAGDCSTCGRESNGQ